MGRRRDAELDSSLKDEVRFAVANLRKDIVQRWTTSDLPLSRQYDIEHALIRGGP